MDWGSLAGLILALTGIVSGHMIDGGHIGSLIQPAAFAVVAAGTCGAVLLQSGMRNFMRGIRMLRWMVVPPKEDLDAMADDIAIWSATARREGFLGLDSYVYTVDDPFTAKGLRLIVDGIEPTKIRSILEMEISSFERIERRAIKIWEAAGGYAPTIGILGAVLGLIHVMENLSEPSKLGSGIAVAFVATIYGIALANLVFLPIANKLKAIVAQEVARREMMVDIFLSIAGGDNSRVIQERIAAYR